MGNDLAPPRDFDENIRYRATILSKAQNDVGLQLALIEMCKRDFFFWADTFLFTYDPRRRFYDDVAIPFIMFDKQRDFITDVKSAIYNHDDIVLEKSRDEGATWMMMALLWYEWNFIDGSDFLLGSMNEESVHVTGDMSSLFEKLFFISKNTPKWLLPKGYKASQHQNFKKLINPERGTSITGQTGKFFATSGRYKAIFMDELSKWEQSLAETSFEASQQSTPCRIVTATPFGQYGVYYRLVSNTTETAPKKTRIHWSDDPRKTKDLEYLECEYLEYSVSPTKNKRLYQEFTGKRSNTPLQGYLPTSAWYRDECFRLMSDPEKGDDGIKQELDIIYIGTGKPYFNQDIVEARKLECKEPLFKGDLELVEHGDIKEGVHWLENWGKSYKSVRFNENPQGNLWIWEMPKGDLETLNYQYAFSCDPAKGLNDENDYTVIEAMNRETGNMSARWYGKTQFVENECYLIFNFFWAKGMFNVDSTGNSTVAINLDAMGIPLISQTIEATHKKKTSERIGFNFDKSSKPLLFQMFRNRLQTNDFTDLDIRLWIQMNSFINDKGVLKGAGKGALKSHDDIVDSKGLVLYCDNEMPPLYEEKHEKSVQEHRNNMRLDNDYESGSNGRKAQLL